MESCIFCAISRGEAPAEIVDEDERTVAFMDINPWARGHALVIPRRHAENLLEIDEADLARTITTARRLAGRMREVLGCEQIVLWNACGAAAGQVVPHFHIHLIPRYAGDPPALPEPKRAEPEELARVAAAFGISRAAVAGGIPGGRD
jgi:histidine triad (HIT) family protein